MNNVFPKQHFSIPDTLDHDLIKVSFDCAPTRGSVCNKQRHVSSIFMFELDVKQQCLLLSHQPLSVCVCEWVYMHLHVCVCVWTMTLHNISPFVGGLSIKPSTLLAH